MNTLLHLMDQFGYWLLFFSLTLELIALPVPTEVLMTYCGFLVYKGVLNWFFTTLIAFLGSSLGITVAYFIGHKLGAPFFEKHGSKFHLGPERLKKTSTWFDKHGKKILIMAYFIPGIRHLTGYFSGITRIKFKAFALYAYTGALLWVFSFITLGKLLGPEWEKYEKTVGHYMFFIVLIIIVAMVIVYVLKNYHDVIVLTVMKFAKRFLPKLHTINRLRLLIAFAALLFIGSFVLLIGIIQNYLTNEFIRFDYLTELIVHSIFNSSWETMMIIFNTFTNYQVLGVIFLLSYLLIGFIDGAKKSLLDMCFGFGIVIGAVLLQNYIPVVFQQIHAPSILIQSFSFPGQEALVSFVVYGWLAFLILRHLNRYFIRISAFILILAIIVMNGISKIYLDIENPMNLVGGYAFGAVWLTLAILLLEIFRLIAMLKEPK